MKFASIFAAAMLATTPTAVLACEARQPENFSGFFNRFAEDKNFAASRTVYPSLRIRYDYGLEGGKQQITESRRTVSRQGDVASQTMGHFIQTNQLEYTTSGISKDKVVVDVLKPGRDWVLSYHFLSKGGCWFLREIQYHAL
ncbi:hypothetical protein [Noviherbaspirillum saxi]|uniref:DUF3828 domain-containing protein n=1 Tax=Noviherbaspirillum saxi TaxID=2320863 RepID=A0A3A3FPY8_9BURK|nr:hypothetical protein [Noviherbaspirillum saxi]RJF97264.1 hypothetical protein D3871_00975 [Noviherbaspirillum saxi]